MPRRVLVANRGEIVLRIARTCHARGLEVVTVHSPHDEGAPHVTGGSRSVGVPSYLDSTALIDAAGASGCDAVHPGYGFLSENAAFARAVTEAGLTWIGPPPDAMATLGSKTSARAHVERAGVPVVPGSAPGTPEQLAGEAARLGYPVLVKAAGGGGGKGMEVVSAPADFLRAARAAADEAARSFADPSVYVEKLIGRARHVEVQVMGDRHGNVVALGERECSIQRRHQKIVEESPSPAVDEALRTSMGDAAIAIARAVGYVSAGTVEYLLAPDGTFYFLEMNTRLQVEHPVTEWVTGLDLVWLQLLVAGGAELPSAAMRPTRRGHAIECRIYAEDPASGFLPQAGRLSCVREPQGPGVRVDSALAEGGDVTIHYDAMLAKLSTWGHDRPEAIARMREALRRFVILGVRTNIDHLQDIVAHPAFARGELSTSFLDDHVAGWAPGSAPPAVLAATALPLATTARRDGPGPGTSNVRSPDPWALLEGFTPCAGAPA
jgi:acetyl/propionyl-CoA carboxylase alpha subunit